MKITQIQIKNFGKLHQMNIRPLSGINVIYGQNESGKSTLYQFITGMLFGMEKQRGKSGKNDSYQRYEPWDGSSFYQGALVFETEGKSFFLERNFYHKEKSAKLVSQGDLEELSVEHGDLEILLGGMKKDTYENTYCIGQAAIETKKEFAGILQNYFINISHTGETDIDLTGAKKKLKLHQKEVEQWYQKEVAARRETEEKLFLEERLIRKDTEQLEEQLRQMKKEGYVPRTAEMLEQLEEVPLENEKNIMLEYLCKEREEKQQRHYRKRTLWGMMIMAMGFVGALWNLFGNHLVQQHGLGKIILELVFVGMFLCGVWIGVYYQKKQRQISKRILEQEKGEDDDPKLREKCQREQQEKEQWAKKQAVVEMLQSQLWEKKTYLMNLKEELAEGAKPSEKEIELGEQQEAYQLAYDTLLQVSEHVYNDTRQKLEEEIANILSEITEEKYNKVGLDEQMNLVVYTQERKLYPWQLSRGTMEQIYFAMRLGIGRCFTKEEAMPILLDEVFASFDEVRLERTLKWLAKQPEQILLFTCQKREMELLQKNKISYGKITLDR
ncbi:MAG: AAA family ATPase [Lachnospiraceae bacterium]